MKNFIVKVFLACFVAAVFGGCAEEDTQGVGDFNLEVRTVGPDFVEVYVTAPSSVEMAYALEKEAGVVSAAVLFMVGDTKIVNPGDLIRLDNVLDSETEYHLYAVAKLNAESYSKVISQKFTTQAYNFNRLLTVVQNKLDGYRVHITVPKSTKDSGNVIRYSAASQAIYNIIKDNAGDETYHVLESIVANGNRHGNYTHNDTTLLRDNSNVVLLDINGNPVLDEFGDQIDIHDPITPGEPTVFIAGECRLGTDEEMGAITNFYYGATDKAYNVPVFDWDTVNPAFDWNNTDRDDWTGTGWTGAFQKLVFKTVEPGLCDATVNIDIPEDEITSTEAMVYFDMDDEVSRYVYMILDNATYNSVVDIYLDKKGAPQEEIDKEFQWFLTSWLAFYEWGVGAYTSDTQVNAAVFFNEGVLGGDETYHVLCTVMVDDPNVKDNPTNAANQRFIHKTFRTKEKKELPPVIEVKAVTPKEPYHATFNIKAPNKDLVGAYYAANYSREFKLMLNSGYTYETLLKGNYTLDSDEIAKINSDEGLEMSFPGLDGEVMRFAIYGCNYEYTFNAFGEKEGTGWADCLIPNAEKVARIESPLYEALAGDWTATATAKINEKDEDGNIVSRNATLTSKVTISNEIPEMPDAVGEDVYAVYATIKDKDGNVKYGRDEVDDMFEELHLLTDNFNEYRVKGQNRLLCTGFLDYDYYENGRMAYKSPYALFSDVDYSSVDVPQLVYDFGPKWYLQLHDDGTVTVPFSTEYLPPMHSWPGYPFYVGGVGGEGDNRIAFLDGEDVSAGALPGFPVEISDDYQTITIKPIVRSDVNYYMNAVGVAQGSYELISTIFTEIVLTKGWKDSGSKPKSKAKSKAQETFASRVNGPAAAPEARIYKSVTKLEPAVRKNFKVDESPNIVTMDMVNKTREKILERYNVKK